MRSAASLNNACVDTKYLQLRSHEFHWALVVVTLCYLDTLASFCCLCGRIFAISASLASQSCPFQLPLVRMVMPQTATARRGTSVLLLLATTLPATFLGPPWPWQGSPSTRRSTWRGGVDVHVQEWDTFWHPMEDTCNWYVTSPLKMMKKHVQRLSAKMKSSIWGRTHSGSMGSLSLWYQDVPSRSSLLEQPMNLSCVLPGKGMNIHHSRTILRCKNSIMYHVHSILCVNIICLYWTFVHHTKKEKGT